MFARLALLATAAAALELTPDSWEEAVEGKTVFIKFFAPWCGHCKKMKPAWDSLMKEYDGHPTKLIADVDCIKEGKKLCDEHGVKGFPTIKYGDPADLQSYEGGRDEKALKKFAEEKLVPMCSPKNIDLCDDDKKAEIAKFSEMDADALASEIEAKEAELKKVEETFKKNVEGLQKQYEGFMKEKDEKISAIKDSGLGLMKAVKAFKAATATKDEL
ncbi:hypothetical protein CTAYLR_005621 [Chrysophaeum taylorii]|uniref:Thioredoxin domain-containing protein n=1 Tax=Chrysophaeum taylorii TaxID=2483200 RepID=A0AAD7UA60_9STRA|nr:hypothetical protein CTAYLR_005621 [Chrysophaeum taylorii]